MRARDMKWRGPRCRRETRCEHGTRYDAGLHVKQAQASGRSRRCSVFFFSEQAHVATSLLPHEFPFVHAGVSSSA